MLAKIFVAALSIASAMAEPPVNNGYLPPPTSSPGYSYPTPSRPLSPGPSPPAYQPTPAPSPPAYRPPAPTPPRPSYGPPSPPAYRPPAPSSPPVYRPPAPPAPPATPAYRPPAPPSPPPYRPPAPPAPQPPRPSYGPPQADVGYKPVGPPPQRPIVPGGNIVNDIAPGYGSDSSDHHHHMPGMPFDFNYAVKDDYYGTDYSHNAVSDGDVVRGEYKVLLPDGRLQIVSYTADWKNGFNADVKYQGEPTYPAAAPANRPSGGYPSGPPAPPSPPTGGYPSGPPSGPSPPSGGSGPY